MSPCYRVKRDQTGDPMSACPICYCEGPEKIQERVITTGHQVPIRSRHEKVPHYQTIIRWECLCCGFQAAPEVFGGNQCPGQHVLRGGFEEFTIHCCRERDHDGPCSWNFPESQPGPSPRRHGEAEGSASVPDPTPLCRSDCASLKSRHAPCDCGAVDRFGNVSRPSQDQQKVEP
jgi:hypothetical protein